MMLAVYRVSDLRALSSGKGEALSSYPGFRLVETSSEKRRVPTSGVFGVSGAIASPLPAEHLGVMCTLVYRALHVMLENTSVLANAMLALLTLGQRSALSRHSSVARV